ncbi:pectin acetylesterase 8-like isoform X2 [Nicotiana tabacum]|uniref:Pectin acetylesterase 8-like isoform X2 n=1 Tax=Nicotiana tabacum TaxID=4097 RepID=A0AC58SSH0_TOBAC|nr:pectin acetylesterase 8-like isoform X2 [Nicotiana tomentosiformis]
MGSIIYAVFVSLLCVSTTTQAQYVNTTILESAVAEGADGSAPAFNFYQGTGARVRRWLLHLEGGGWCDTTSNCLTRAGQVYGSSKQIPPQAYFTGILSNDPELNPDFYDWNKVKIRYCDGASYTGDVEEVDPSTNLHYRGARIFKAIVQHLLAKGMYKAENAILSGTSAGGLAAILNCDKFNNLLPLSVRVRCISDSGFFVNVETISGYPHIQELFYRVVKLHGSAKNLPQACAFDYDKSLCFFPQYVAPYMQTPLFIINSAYDSWQVNYSFVPKYVDPLGVWNNCKHHISQCTPSQLQILDDYRLKFLKALQGLGPSSSRGYFIISCHTHNIVERQSYWMYKNSPTLDNKKIAKAVGDWYFERSGFQKIACPYPCGCSILFD